MDRSVKITSPDGQAAQSKTELTVEAVLFPPSDWVPNNPTLPVIIYHQAVPEGSRAVETFEHLFRQAGWQGLWRNGIFDYHHYLVSGTKCSASPKGARVC